MARSSRLGSSGILGSRRRRVLGAMVSLVALVAVTACGSQEAQWQQPGGSTAQALPAKLTFSHEKDAKDVSPGTPVSVQVIDGTLDTVTLTSNLGEVKGEFVNDTLWRSVEDLDYSKTYTLSVKGTGEDGKTVEDVRTFSTPTVRNGYYWNVYLKANTWMTLDGGTYGVGQPIVATFDDDVDRKIAEQTLTVTTNPPVEGSWSWDPNRNEAHWRPEKYWTPGTKVTVEARVLGVTMKTEDGRELHGKENKSASFTIGAAKKVASINDQTHQMQVYIDNVLARTIPVSMGRPTGYRDISGVFHDYRTGSGVHVVTEKHDPVEMRPALPCPLKVEGSPGCDPGYYVEIIPKAVRITNDGIYVHAASWSVGDQGYRNVSHGCVNISPANAAWFYDNFGAGDVVEIANTGKALNPWDGLGDWTTPWDQWKKGSALYVG